MYTWTIAMLGRTSTVNLKTEDPNAMGKPSFRGDSRISLFVKDYLSTEGYGAFGHAIDLNDTSAIDLDYALSASTLFSTERTEGDLEDYDPDIPADAFT